MVEPTTEMKSCLYVGRVRHRRFAPVVNEFTYSGFWLYLDLSELDRVFDGRLLWSTRRRSIASFRREDHLVFPDDVIPEALLSRPPGSTTPDAMSLGRKPQRQPHCSQQPLPPLDQSVRDLVEAATNSRPTGPIRLLTQPRYFGYCMNPVSFYYCFDEADESVEAIVAEVNNTPWRERHCYVLSSQNGTENALLPAMSSQFDAFEVPSSDSTSERLRFQHAKRFHVSPFMQMDMDYQWNVVSPGRSLTVHIENWQNGSRLLDCTLQLKRRPISGFGLARSLCRFPFMTGKIVAAIHWQALRLWWKGCPYIPHPGIPDSVDSSNSNLDRNGSEHDGESDHIEPSMEHHSSVAPQDTEAVAS